MECFFLAMTLHPEVQRKAQDEIHQVLGPCELLTVADRPRLPYINAVVKEVLRWHPVGPMGIPHASSEDDMWGPYFIPKGSVILPNIW
jgi:cytochrome P450